MGHFLVKMCATTKKLDPIGGGGGGGELAAPPRSANDLLPQNYCLTQIVCANFSFNFPMGHAE